MFKRSRKISKIMVSLPIKALGGKQIGQNNELLKQQYRKIKAPMCPHCYESIMEIDIDSPGVRRTFEIQNDDGSVNTVSVNLYKWVCLNKNCGVAELMPESNSEAKEWAKDMHNAIVADKITDLTDEELDQYAKTHKFYSRLYYLAALVCFLYFMYILAFSKISIFKICLPYTGVTTAFFVNGMRRSYRYWQLQNKIIFQEGAFKEWLKSGNWFV